MRHLFFLLFTLNASLSCAQENFLPAGVSEQERYGFINEFKKLFCDDNPFIKQNSTSYSLVDLNTRVLRFYPFVSFIGESYTYKDNPVDYLQTRDYQSMYYLYNEHLSNVDTVIGMVSIDPEDTCYHLKQSEIGVSPKYFEIIKPILHQVDLRTATIFMLSNITQEPEVYLIINNEVSVIKGKNLIPFNVYYKTKYSIEKFKSMYYGVEIK